MIEAEVRAMKLKHRIMLWYAKRKAKKQAGDSARQVAGAPGNAGSKATSAASRHPAGRNRRRS
jgi:hypothetical protein